MSAIRPKALPRVTTVTAGDVLVLDGFTVRSITVANLITSAVNLTGPITSVGNATSLGSQTGTGSKIVVDTAPTLVTPVLGVATATSINKVAFTAPATGSTLTIPDGVTMTGPTASGTVVTLGNVETITGAKTFNDGKLILAGATSGTTVLKSGGTAGSSVITLPVATDTLIGKATTDVLTNKTLDSAGTGNVLKVSGVTVSAGQYPATATNDNATAGNFGEYTEGNLAGGSATALVTGTPKTVTSITLGAGDWDVFVNMYYLLGATTNLTNILTSLSLVTNTLDTANGRFSQTFWAPFVPGAVDVSNMVGPQRFSLSGSTTIFAIAQSNFTVSTCSAFGIMHARRVR